jgi:hypothetical protein
MAAIEKWIGIEFSIKRTTSAGSRRRCNRKGDIHTTWSEGVLRGLVLGCWDSYLSCSDYPLHSLTADSLPVSWTTFSVDTSSTSTTKRFLTGRRTKHQLHVTLFRQPYSHQLRSVNPPQNLIWKHVSDRKRSRF